MNQNELIQYIATDANVTQLDTRNALQSLAKAIRLTLRKNGTIKLLNVGTFYMTRTNAKMMRNPRTQAQIYVPVRRHMKLKTSRKINDELN